MSDIDFILQSMLSAREQPGTNMVSRSSSNPCDTQQQPRTAVAHDEINVTCVLCICTQADPQMPGASIGHASADLFQQQQQQQPHAPLIQPLQQQFQQSPAHATYSVPLQMPRQQYNQPVYSIPGQQQQASQQQTGAAWASQHGTLGVDLPTACSLQPYSLLLYSFGSKHLHVLCPFGAAMLIRSARLRWAVV